MNRPEEFFFYNLKNKKIKRAKKRFFKNTITKHINEYRKL